MSDDTRSWEERHAEEMRHPPVTARDLLAMKVDEGLASQKEIEQHRRVLAREAREAAAAAAVPPVTPQVAPPVVLALVPAPPPATVTVLPVKGSRLDVAKRRERRLARREKLAAKLAKAETVVVETPTVVPSLVEKAAVPVQEVRKTRPRPASPLQPASSQPASSAPPPPAPPKLVRHSRPAAAPVAVVTEIKTPVVVEIKKVPRQARPARPSRSVVTIPPVPVTVVPAATVVLAEVIPPYDGPDQPNLLDARGRVR